jgi:hypothetical protein
MRVVLECMKTKEIALTLANTDDVLQRNNPDILDTVHLLRLKTLDVSENGSVFFLWLEGEKESTVVHLENLSFSQSSERN